MRESFQQYLTTCYAFSYSTSEGSTLPEKAYRDVLTSDLHLMNRDFFFFFFKDNDSYGTTFLNGKKGWWL